MRRFLYVTRGVAWRSIHNTIVNPAILVPSIIFPLFFLVAFAGGLSRISDLPNFHYKPGYTSFQFVFVFLQSAAFGGVFTGFAVARDFQSGFARRLLLGAPRRSGIIAGYVVGALGRWLITGTIVTIAALIAGMHVDGNGERTVSACSASASGMNFTAALWAIGIAMFLRTEQAGPLIQMPVFVALFLAPVYVPLTLLTGWVHAVSQREPDHRGDRGRAAGLLAGSPVEGRALVRAARRRRRGDGAASPGAGWPRPNAPAESGGAGHAPRIRLGRADRMGRALQRGVGRGPRPRY